MKFIVFLLLIFAFALVAEARPPKRLHTPYIGYRRHTASPYWRVTRRTASGKHSYRRAAWPREHACAGMYSRLPVKDRTVRRYHFYRPTRQ